MYTTRPVTASNWSHTPTAHLRWPRIKPLQKVPMRPLDAAARSRMHCTRHQSRKFVPGRRWMPPRTCQQRALPGRPTPPRCCRWLPWRSWHLESTHATTTGAHVREGGDVERSCASEGQGCSGRAVCKRVCRGRWISPSWQRAAAFAALPQLCCEHGNTIMRARRRACASQPGRCWRASAAALDE